MRAVVVTSFGGPENLALETVPDPVPGPGQVVVDVVATALNRADLLQRRGKYPPPKGETEILGLECSGFVAELGPGCQHRRQGERVMALLAGGGYAERVVIDERMALPLPEGLSLIEAAAVPEAFLTAQEALFSLGRLESGETVLVHAAAGGVGSAALQLARLAGARVIATASAQKLDFVTALGAEVVVDSRSENFVELVLGPTEQRGVDVVLDVIGASLWEKHVACMAAGGRCVVVGVMGGIEVRVNLATLLFKRHQLLGLVMRSRSLADKIRFTEAFATRFLPAFGTGALKPVVDSVYPVERVREAHERMEANLNRGKIILALRQE